MIITSFRLAVALLCLGLWWTVTSGQASTPDHTVHHPGKNANAQTATPSQTPNKAESMSQPSASPGMPQMENEMEQMMNRAASPPKELYPTLMDLPELSQEKRAEVERLAHERMENGKALMSAAFDSLTRTSARQDYPAMQQASAQLREALAQYESGLAAHRALAEGKAPRNVALLWFKREMNLTASVIEPETRLFGLPSRWFHYFVIAILSFLVGSMILMYFHKMRRAEKLLMQLAGDAKTRPGAKDDNRKSAKLVSTDSLKVSE